MKKSKHRNEITLVDNIKFHSKKEANHYIYLKFLEKSGQITELTLQRKFVLIPSQKTSSVSERPLTYIADFTYKKDGTLVVEDVKGYKKDNAYALFVAKRKLMLFFHGIEVSEV